jgi:hypothetical protein
MNQESIFIPFFGTMLLTILVWAYMYYLRLSFMARKKIDPQDLATNAEAIDLIPAKVNTPSENLINLFELPVLFYATCIFLYVTGRVDNAYLSLAYGFLFLRIFHSAIHCTYNKVTHRFYVYILSAVTLWAMIFRAFIAAVNA